MQSRAHAAQYILKEKGYYSGEIDGKIGPKSLASFAKYQGVNTVWSTERQIAAVIQLRCNELNFNAGKVDGFWGPSTDAAYKQFLFYVENNTAPPAWRPEDRTPVNPNKWPKAYTSEFNAFYGPVGESNLVRVNFPYTMRIAWDLNSKVNSTRCHKKVAESTQKVLEAVLNHYGVDAIKALKLDLFGGCYNNRPIRGGSKPSMHSWGIAYDFDPTRNQLHWGRDKASFAKPDYDFWWQCWEAEGWVSLGRERNFDWMHVQAALI